ncbi:hypothetical protein AWB71_05092 [Caballeronia peredens]|nr:hypothetical protein AWB71_05092 [Caballeronia peredens]
MPAGCLGAEPKATPIHAARVTLHTPAGRQPNPKEKNRV